MTFDNARELAHLCGDGIGLALGTEAHAAEHQLVAVDIDGCIDEQGVISQADLDLVMRLDSYTERPPSGHGLRIWIRGKKPGPKCRTAKHPNPLLARVELYIIGRYLTVTGRHLEGTPLAIATRQAALNDLYGEMFPKRRTSPQANGQTHASKPLSDSNNELLDRARSAVNGSDFVTLYDLGDTSAYGGDESAADMALMNHLAFWTGCDADRMEAMFSDSALGQRGKWRDRPDYRQRTINEAISGCPNPYKGNGKAASNAKPKAETPVPELNDVNLTELGNARRLIARHGHRLRYCKPLGRWLEWDGRRWAPDQSGAIWRYAKDVISGLAQEAAQAAEDRDRQALMRWALKSEEKKTLQASIDLAWSEPGVTVMPEALDSYPWLFNCQNGTVDLKTGKLRPHCQRDLLTKLCPVVYDPAAKCPRWEATILEICGGDADLVAFLQRCIGYSLTGDAGEHAIFVCYGTGRNGKNTVLDTIRAIIGDYATVTNPRVFMNTGRNEHPTGLADLVGKHFVLTDEVEDGERLAESLIKRVTGNATLKARFCRQDFFEFPVLFKLWFAVNYKPEVKGQDEGVWSRLKLIPFEVFFPPEKRIKNLSKQLQNEEGPGILAWAVRGCLEWQRVGLSDPAKVTVATRAYRDEQDVIGDFIDQCCNSHLDHPTLRTQAREKAAILYDRYVRWCQDSGEKTVLGNRKFSGEMQRRGYQLKPSNGSQYRLGITIRPADKGTSNENGEF